MMKTSSVEKLDTYLFSYRHNGAEWGLEIQAKSAADARARIDRLQYATLDGKLVATIPATAGVLARAYVFIRNLLLAES